MVNNNISETFARGRNKLASMVVIGHATKHIYFAALQIILLPELKMGMGLTSTQFGVLFTGRQAAGWVTTIAAGYMGDRFADRAPLLLGISMVILGVSYFLAGSATHFWIMFLAMLLVGIGPSLYHPPAIGILSRKFPDKRGFMISLHGTGGSIGNAIGPMLTALLLSFLGWRAILQLSLFPSVIIGLLLWGSIRQVPGIAAGSSSLRGYLSSLVLLLKKKALLLLVIVASMRSMAQMAVVTFLPVYLREDLVFSATSVAFYMTLAQVLGIATQPVLGYASDKIGRKLVLMPAMTVLALLFIMLKLADPGMQLIITIIAMGAFLYSLQSIVVASAMDIAGSDIQATVVSLIYGASLLGIVSPLIAGVLADQFGTSTVFLASGLLVLMATIILVPVNLSWSPNNAEPNGSAQD